MGAHLGVRGDLAAGCLAVGTLAVLVLILQLNLVLASILAVATYLGVLLLRPSGVSRLKVPWDAMGERWPANDIREASWEEQTYATAFARAQALRALSVQLAEPTVHTQVGLILDRVDQIMTAMADDDDLSQLPVLDSCLFAPLLELLSTYLTLAERKVQSAGEMLARIESDDLPLILEAVDDFYERMHSRKLTDLAAMSELIEFNLESVRAMMRRRATP